jgi:hypothetical protein
MITNDAITMSKRVPEVRKLQAARATARSTRLHVAKEFPYNIIGSFRDANPFVIAFVYPRNDKPCVVKGGCNDVEEYIKVNYPIAFVYETMWKEGKSRTNYLVVGCKKSLVIHLVSPRTAMFIAKHSYENNRHYDKPIRWHLTVFERKGMYLSSGKPLFEKYMKKPPRSWIKELDPYVSLDREQSQ